MVIRAAIVTLVLATSALAAEPDPAVRQLAGELRGKGWIAYSAVTDRGDWDLFLCRPDGSERQRLTKTPEQNEAGPRFSPDGRRLLYYRVPRTEPVDNNSYGRQELVIADANGANPVSMGKEYPWASWGPNSQQIACLARAGIQIVDLATREVVRQLPRKGIVQQLSWSPDGQSLTGTANGLGAYWNIGRVIVRSGRITPVSETERYNCTPDWMPDSTGILYSRGIVPELGGFAELWRADADGSDRRLLYAEEGRHIYGGCASPDGKYVLFTRSVEDLGRVDNSKTSMSIVRLADTPMAIGAAARNNPGARSGPRFDLGWGWEPHWTEAETAGQVKREK